MLFSFVFLLVLISVNICSNASSTVFIKCTWYDENRRFTRKKKFREIRISEEFMLAHIQIYLRKIKLDFICFMII